MTWRKSPPQLIELFYEAVPDDPRVEPRKMFGYPCCFVNGNMFMGLHQESFIIRLKDTDREKILALPGVREFAPMPGRVMKEYAALSPKIMKDGSTLRKWIGRSLEYASSLPAKSRIHKSKSGSSPKGRKK